MPFLDDVVEIDETGLTEDTIFPASESDARNQVKLSELEAWLLARSSPGAPVTIGLSSALPASGVLGQQYITTDARGSYVHDGTNFRRHTGHGLLLPYGPITLTDWTQANLDASASFSQVGHGVHFQSNGTNNAHVQYAKKTLAVKTAFTLDVAISSFGNPGRANTCAYAGLRYIASDRFLLFGYLQATTSQVIQVYFSDTANGGGPSGVFLSENVFSSEARIFRVVYNGTTFVYHYSLDGTNFKQFATLNRVNYFAGHPDEMIIAGSFTYAQSGNTVKSHADFLNLVEQ